MALLQVENLTFRYPQADAAALTGVSFTLRPGSFTLLWGASGCGKSTLLRLIKRELAPYGAQTGAILFDGQALTALDARAVAGGIGLVQQNPDSQIVTDKVWHELAFGLESLGTPPSVMRRRVAEMAHFFGIESWLHRDTDTLSGGQKQLLNLAAVMVMQPRLLLLDEPTAQLDPVAADQFLSVLEKLNRELGLTILLAEHRLEAALPLADQALLMEEGRLTCAASPRGLGAYFREHPAHPMAAGLPAAARLWLMTEGTGECPLTVREGRDFLLKNFDNRIDRATHAAAPAPSAGEAALRLKGVWFRYEREGTDVLRDVSLTVYRGEHLCLLGGNGAGKSTLMEIMAGLRQPFRGRVTGEKAPALLPQDPQTVFLKKTLREEYADLGGTPVQAEALTARLGIAPLLDRHPFDLSGGEQQRAALAALLLRRPSVLLLDEPTKGLDASARREMGQLLAELRREGVTVVSVTHDVDFAAETASRCGLMFDGEVTALDAPASFFCDNSFYTTAANRMTRGFYHGVILCEEAAALCRQNGGREERA